MIQSTIASLADSSRMIVHCLFLLYVVVFLSCLISSPPLLSVSAQSPPSPSNSSSCPAVPCPNNQKCDELSGICFVPTPSTADSSSWSVSWWLILIVIASVIALERLYASCLKIYRQRHPAVDTANFSQLHSTDEYDDQQMEEALELATIRDDSPEPTTTTQQ